MTSPSAAPTDCPDAGATLIYVVTNSNALMSFYPPTATFKTIGRLVCPARSGSSPFSMAVSRSGTAYVLFSDQVSDAELFRVSTADASCQTTRFVAHQHGFGINFGMAYAQDTNGTNETLYVAEGGEMPDGGLCLPSRLASIDTNTFALSLVGTIRPAICSPELTGTGAGDLFGFFARGKTDSAIAQIDKTTGQLTRESILTGLVQTDPSGGGGTGAWAVAFWGGDFYAFTTPTNTNTVVTRFRPSDGSLVQVGQLTDQVVGAGVSTCAPQ